MVPTVRPAPVDPGTPLEETWTAEKGRKRGWKQTLLPEKRKSRQVKNTHTNNKNKKNLTL
jgi:hypothetical protein